MIKQIITLVIAVALIFFSLGLVSANQLIKILRIERLSSAASLQNTFQAGWEAARQRLKDSGFMPKTSNLEIKTVNGEIKQIKDNQIEIKIQQFEPLADPELDIRIVQIQDDTKVYQLVQKDRSEYQKEIEEFNKNRQEQAKNPAERPAAGSLIAPELFIRKEASLSDIKAGQRIYVLAADNIRTAKEFKAVEISIR